MNLANAIGIRCHYCSKFRAPSDVFPIGTGGATICLYCRNWHEHAIKMLAGHPPPGCQECGLTFRELRERKSSGDSTNVKMFLHAKDGVYQVLCSPCSDSYMRKRVDLYGDTAFGHQQKLK